MNKKKLSILMLTVAFIVFGVALGAMAVPPGPGEGITGSFHDLSSTGEASTLGDLAEQGGLNRICIYCHSPHHTLKPEDASLAEINYVPLWNHAITTNTDWKPYDNGIDDPNDPQHYADSTTLADMPGSVSLLCLSCHDGSVAVNQYGFSPASLTERHATGVGDSSMPERALIGFGADLSNHHPIGFDYASVAAATGGADDEIADPLTAMGTTGKSIGELLWGGKMECGTCHDVHNTKNKGSKFTWVEDTNSAFCKTCHLK
jgi:hypothetical protein